MKNGVEVSGQIKIEKRVPLPSGKHHKLRYPWAEMEVGDSFLFPTDLKNGSAYNITKATSARLAPKLFKASRVPGGMRAWRIA